MSKNLSFHHQPANLRWPFFAGILIIFEVILGFLMDWQSAAFLSPLIAYGSAALSFNRIDILINDKHVSWKERPFPLRRMRKLKTSDIEAWAYGVTPSSSKGGNRPRFSVAALRHNRKINRLVDDLPTVDEAKSIAVQLSEETGIPPRPLHSLRGPAKGKKRYDLWILLAALVGFLVFAALMSWLS